MISLHVQNCSTFILEMPKLRMEMELIEIGKNDLEFEVLQGRFFFSICANALKKSPNLFSLFFLCNFYIISLKGKRSKLFHLSSFVEEMLSFQVF